MILLKFNTFHNVNGFLTRDKFHRMSRMIQECQTDSAGMFMDVDLVEGSIATHTVRMYKVVFTAINE